MKDISVLLAFSAGLLSFLSPCVLPLVPAYIGYLTGSSVNELKEKSWKPSTLYKSLGFVLGFSFIFIIMGASATTFGRLFAMHRELFRKTGGILIIIFGIHLTGIWKVKLFYREKRYTKLDKFKGPFSSVVLGMAFAAGWTPCVGPILSSILVYAAGTNSLAKGILLLSFYSAGLAVPFVLTAAALDSFYKLYIKISKYLSVISIVSGIFLLLMGVLIFTNQISLLSRYSNFLNI